MSKEQTPKEKAIEWYKEDCQRLTGTQYTHEQRMIKTIDIALSERTKDEIVWINDYVNTIRLVDENYYKVLCIFRDMFVKKFGVDGKEVLTK